MKPILLNTDMVRAILDGRKSVTRRVVKPQPEFTPMKTFGGSYRISDNVVVNEPYYPGDILYVRETFAALRGSDGSKQYVYKATDKYPFEATYVVKFRWHPSIHMPKEAARLFLRVTEVRVERLQDITVEQAIAEGAKNQPCEKWVGERTERDYFANLWDSTIKKADLPRYGWKANPWVWVIGFGRISKEEEMKNALA